MKLPASTTICGLALVGLVLLAGGLPQAGADEVLIDFGQDFDVSKVVTSDAKVSVSKAAAS